MVGLLRRLSAVGAVAFAASVGSITMAGRAWADPVPRVSGIGAERVLEGAYLQSIEPQLRSFASAVGACVAQARRRGPMLSTEHQVYFQIGVDGRVSSVMVVSRDGSAISECVSTLGGRMRFPRPRNPGRAWASYTFPTAGERAPSLSPSVRGAPSGSTARQRGGANAAASR